MTSAEHAEDSERPPTNKIDENVNRMQELVLENRRITIHEVADTLGQVATGCQPICSYPKYRMSSQIISRQCKYAPDCRQIRPTRGELSYLAPLCSENISAPYFKQCFFGGGCITP